VRWLCDDDFRVHALSRGKVKSRTTTRQTTEQDINLLAARHNSNKRWKRVDVWLVPLTPKCAYVMVRIILWCLFGLVAGVVPAAPDGTWHWSHNVRIWDHSAVATHMADLHRGKHWPRGTARIVLAGVSDTDLIYSPSLQVAKFRGRKQWPSSSYHKYHFQCLVFSGRTSGFNFHSRRICIGNQLRCIVHQGATRQAGHPAPPRARPPACSA
jgi:hypothetical protein